MQMEADDQQRDEQVMDQLEDRFANPRLPQLNNRKIYSKRDIVSSRPEQEFVHLSACLEDILMSWRLTTLSWMHSSWETNPMHVYLKDESY
jgi:hypothetical protein